MAANQVNPAKPRLDPAQIEILMVHVFRCEAVAAEALSEMTADIFSQTSEQHYEILWQTYLDHHAQYGRAPSLAILETQALSRIRGLGNGSMAASLYDAVEVEPLRQRINQFAAIATGFPADSLYEAYGLELLKDFLHERTVADPLLQAFENARRGGGVPADLSELFNDFRQRQSRIETMAANCVLGIDDLNLDAVAGDRRTTGVPFFDITMTSDSLEDASRPISGGWMERECYTLLGTWASGKTTLGGQLAAEGSRRMPLWWPNERRAAVFVTYELPPETIMRRCLAHVASIPFSRLGGANWRERLSTSTDPRSLLIYEENLTQNGAMGERERLAQAWRDLGHLKLIDMRHSRHNPKRGRGFIPEIQNELDRLYRTEGIKPGIIVIDYALLCTRRHITFLGKDMDRTLRHYLTVFCDTCRNLLADHFDCGVWVLHQMKGDANNKSPTTKQKLGDAAECHSWPENFDYCFILNSRDKQHNCLRFQQEKARYSPAIDEDIILRFDGRFSRLVLTDEFVSDASGAFVPRAFANRVAPPGGADAPRRRGEVAL